MKDKFMLGADPEFFLLENGKPKSAIGIIKGTKEKPFKISSDGHSVQVDNVLFEFNVPPARTPIEMHKNISFVLDWFDKNVKTSTREFSFKSSYIFPEEELQSRKAKEFGCDPDFNVWTESLNNPPSEESNLRSAGGHIHVSYKDASIPKTIELVKLFDLFLGVPSVIYDEDKRRRELYGKAGAFRFKDYPNGESGFEYRVLSNFWITNLDYISWVYKQVEKAIFAYARGFRVSRESSFAEEIVTAINTSDKSLAKKIMEKYS